MKKNVFKSLLMAAVMLVAVATPSFAQFQNFENKTHTPEVSRLPTSVSTSGISWLRKMPPH